MRLFVAIEIEPEVARAAADSIDELRSRVRARAPHARITWMSPEHLHLTVRFIGEVTDGMVPAIQEALEPALEVAPFGLTFEGVGVFPPHGPPRVLWAGVGNGLDWLRQVQREVGVRLGALGIPAVDGEFKPHVTLSRVREAAGLGPAALLETVTDCWLGASRVDAITLFQSRLSPQGPAYVRLGRTALGEPGARRT